MNYILFSNSESKIIQMTPLVNLTESNKEIRKLIIQWFIPIMGELIFWTSSVQPCELDRYKDDEFVGNNSRYTMKIQLVLIYYANNFIGILNT